MRKRKYYLYLTAEERRYIFNALLAFRNRLIPNKAGSKIIIDDIITLILFFLSIIIIPFQICNP